MGQDISVPSSDTQEPRSTTTERNIRAEQVTLLYRAFPSVALAIVANALIISFIFRNVVAHSTIFIWLGCNVFITLLRYMLVRRFWSSQVDEDDIGRWGSYYVTGMAIAGAAFGASGVFLFPSQSIAHQVFLAYVLGGMVAGAAGLYSIVRGAFIVYSVPAVTPIIVRFLIEGDEIHIAMALMGVFFLTVMTLTARRMYSNTLKSLDLRFKNEDLVSYLSKAKEKAEGLNDALLEEIGVRRTAEEQLKHKTRELEVLTEDLRKLSSLISKEDDLSRKKLAGILHEQIGQNLSVFSMNFDDISEGVITGDTDIRDTIANLTTLLEDTIKSTRELTADLYPTILDDLGFLSAVTWYKEMVLDPLKIEVLMEIDNSVEGLSSDYKLSLFRILQEAVQNIAKHARATKVEVRYTSQSDTRKLYVKDNGIGFDLEEVKVNRNKGIGLILLKERSIALGGSLTIDSAPGMGTELTIELPPSR